VIREVGWTKRSGFVRVKSNTGVAEQRSTRVDRHRVFGAIAACGLLIGVRPSVAVALCATRSARSAPSAPAGHHHERRAVGLLIAVGVGSVLAVVSAIGLSPLAPIGVVRPVYPDLGVAFDWTVLGAGLWSCRSLCTLRASGLSSRATPRDSQREEAPGVHWASCAPRPDLELPVPAVGGIRFALDPGPAELCSRASVIVGATLALLS